MYMPPYLHTQYICVSIYIYVYVYVFHGYLCMCVYIYIYTHVNMYKGLHESCKATIVDSAVAAIVAVVAVDVVVSRVGLQVCFAATA